MSNNKYTNEELIQILKDYYIQYGEPKYNYFNENSNLPNAGIYERRFKNWSTAKELAGIPLNKRKYKHYTNEELLIILKEQFIQNPNISIHEFDANKTLPHSKAYMKAFGSWNNAKNLIGEKINTSQYAEKELLDIMKKAFLENPNLTHKDFCSKNNLPSGTAYENCFGSFNNAKLKAGIKVTKYRNTYTDEELWNILKRECEANPSITIEEFNNREDLPHGGIYCIRLGGFDNAKNKLGFQSDKSYNRIYTNEELLEILREYNKKYGFPTNRAFKRENGLPSSSCYYDSFGNFENALILAGIEIPKNRKKLFSRTNEYTFDEIKEECQMLIDLYLQDHIKLPPIEYFNNSEFLSESMLYRLFGGYKKIYDFLNYDADKFNNELLEKDMLEKYNEICSILGKSANSREIDEFSRNNKYYYGCTTYSKHFNGIKGLYEKVGDLSKLNLSRYMKKDEIISNLYKLRDELEFIPTQIEINKCRYLPSVNYILNTLNYNGMAELQIALFGEKIERANRYITEKGTKCLSTYEYIVAQVIEGENYNFIKDERYKNHIDIDKNYSCDFVILKNDKIYFIEVFGMMGHKPYEEKTKLKIQLCKDNNIPLLELYPKDISTSQMDEIEYKIKKFIKNN